MSDSPSTTTSTPTATTTATPSPDNNNNNNTTTSLTTSTSISSPTIDYPTTTIPRPRLSRPASEALLNEKWDHCLSSLLIRSSIGLSFGIIFSVLIFKRRAWPAWVGLGFGAGRAWEGCDAAFKRGGVMSSSLSPTEGLRLVRS